MHRFRGFSGVNPIKPYVMSTNNTLDPASQVFSGLCSSRILLEQEPLPLLGVGIPCSSLGNRVYSLIKSGASFNFISQSLI